MWVHESGHRMCHTSPILEAEVINRHGGEEIITLEKNGTTLHELWMSGWNLLLKLPPWWLLQLLLFFCNLPQLLHQILVPVSCRKKHNHNTNHLAATEADRWKFHHETKHLHLVGWSEHWPHASSKMIHVYVLSSAFREAFHDRCVSSQHTCHGYVPVKRPLVDAWPTLRHGECLTWHDDVFNIHSFSASMASQQLHVPVKLLWSHNSKSTNMKICEHSQDGKWYHDDDLKTQRKSN